MKKQKRPRSGRADRKTDVSGFRSGGRIPSDVLGSYTGTPANGDAPVQDADDL